jgi:hypothetical protein
VTNSLALSFRHELGHALGLLGDEYPDGGVVLEKYSINVSTSDRDVPWKAALEARASGVGVHKVAGVRRTYFRAEERCVMQENSTEYGPVCKWGMAQGIYRHVRLLDEFGTNEAALEPEFAPEIKVKFLAPASGRVEVQWGYRAAGAEDEAFEVRGPEAFEARRGWTTSPGHLDADKREAAFSLRKLPKGNYVVAVVLRDAGPWMFADPWKVAVDGRAWVVKA